MSQRPWSFGFLEPELSGETPQQAASSFYRAYNRYDAEVMVEYLHASDAIKSVVAAHTETRQAYDEMNQAIADAFGRPCPECKYAGRAAEGIFGWDDDVWITDGQWTIEGNRATCTFASHDVPYTFVQGDDGVWLLDGATLLAPTIAGRAKREQSWSSWTARQFRNISSLCQSAGYSYDASQRDIARVIGTMRAGCKQGGFAPSKDLIAPAG